MTEHEKAVFRKLRSQRDVLLGACKATLLIYSANHWNTKARDEWQRLTGAEAPTLLMWDVCQAAIAYTEGDGT